VALALYAVLCWCVGFSSDGQLKNKETKKGRRVLAFIIMKQNEIYLGDCLELMPQIADETIDMILCDLPYGTTACKWDTVVKLDKLWEQYKRVIKIDGAIVLFCQQPFTSALISSNYEMFKYMWYWRKSRPSGFVNAKLKPLKDIEEIAVFSKGTTANRAVNNMVYYPQGLIEVNKKWKRPQTYGTGKGVNPTRKSHQLERVIQFEGYPRQVLDFNKHNANQFHETEKPIELIEYLIKTYTNEGELILDNCAGSGTTGLGAKNLNRNYIMIEKEEKYFDIAKSRLNGTI